MVVLVLQELAVEEPVLEEVVLEEPMLEEPMLEEPMLEELILEEVVPARVELEEGEVARHILLMPLLQARWLVGNWPAACSRILSPWVARNAQVERHSKGKWKSEVVHHISTSC